MINLSVVGRGLSAQHEILRARLGWVEGEAPYFALAVLWLWWPSQFANLPVDSLVDMARLEQAAPN